MALDAGYYDTLTARTQEVIGAGLTDYADVGLPPDGALPPDWTRDLIGMSLQQRSDYRALLQTTDADWSLRLQQFIDLGA